MQASTKRIQFLDYSGVIEDRILILGIGYGQRLMNLAPSSPNDLNLAKLQAKAVELLNQPDTFKERLTLSVVALLDEDELDDGVDDDVLEGVIEDAFDALAGVARATT